jgi:hypothetical protein
MDNLVIHKVDLELPHLLHILFVVPELFVLRSQRADSAQLQVAQSQEGTIL